MQAQVSVSNDVFCNAFKKSKGNHALALAYHGKRLGIPVTVVMPTIAPLTKVNRCGKYGAKV